MKKYSNKFIRGDIVAGYINEHDPETKYLAIVVDYTYIHNLLEDLITGNDTRPINRAYCTIIPFMMNGIINLQKINEYVEDSTLSLVFRSSYSNSLIYFHIERAIEFFADKDANRYKDFEYIPYVNYLCKVYGKDLTITEFANYVGCNLTNM